MKTFLREEPLDYAMLVRQLDGLLSGESDLLANAANFAAFVFAEVDRINWAGFYFSTDDGLVLGPFCGKPACTRLPQGKGVCGAAVREKSTIVVDDVDAFADHIACDSASKSEIVVPLLFDGVVAGVFDIDSPDYARFTTDDRLGIEALVKTFLARTAFPARLRRGRTTLRDELSRALCEYRLEHADILAMLDGFTATDASPDEAMAFLARFAPMTLAHMRHEEGWLFPRVMRGGDMLKKRGEHIAREAKDTTTHVEDFLDTWTSAERIAEDLTRFRSEFRCVDRAIRARIVAEEEDLFTATLAEFA